jgi:hypothetical protein
MMRRPVPFVLLATLSACEMAPEAELPAAEEIDTVEGAATSVATCTALTFTKGRLHSGQSATTLARRELTGTQDVWEKYVEFDPGSEASCSFNVSATGLSGLAARVNYRGPRKTTMRWVFEAFDATTSAWVYVGDNAFAGDWVWTARDLALPAPVSRFVSGGKVRVRYRAVGTADASLLDEWVLVVTTSSTSPTPTPTPTPTPGTIWRPAPGTTWQWQLSGTINTSYAVSMYDVDLFDAPQSKIDELRNAGRKVICYFSAGSREDWRPDASQFPSTTYKNALDGWPGERWLDIRNSTVRSIMKKRLDLAVQKRCHGVEPDNVDAYTHNTGFALTAANQIDYNRFLAAEAHARGLSIGLKNDLGQVTQLVGDFDWALNESCGVYRECGLLRPFIDAGKAVFHVEYVEEWGSTSCPSISRPAGFSSLLKNYDLDAWRKVCP